MVTLNVSLQLWRQRNNRRTLNKMFCGNKEDCQGLVPNNNMWEKALVDSHIPYINCPATQYSLVIN